MMKKPGTILIVDDNKNILTALRILLGGYFGKVVTQSSPKNLITTLREEAVDLVLLDMNFSAGINNGNEGIFWLTEIKKAEPEIPVVLITAYADISLAVKAIKEGASDFIVKPWNNNELIDKLTTVYDQRRKSSGSDLRTEGASDEKSMFWGKSPAMSALRELIAKVATTDVNILITGENGTGKEILAREIHRLSHRRHKDIVNIDMGAITETLFESELFGHVKGAFTDARNDRTGKFEAASGGTLFLDEIGNLPYPLQAKLLAALQNRQIVRVGSNVALSIDIRLVCATNKDLQEMVSLQLFREDLLYRINTIHVEIPPLRERIEDIGSLAALFLKKYAPQYRKEIDGITENARTKLQKHPWYGNIRELEHVVEKAVILCDRNVLTEDDFILQAGTNGNSKEIDFSTLKDMEQVMIKNAMDKFGGNLSLVASNLGITRQTLYNKIKKYGM